MTTRIRIEVIKPKKVLDPRKIQRAMNRGLDQWAENIKKDYEKTVNTWKHKPSFIITKKTAYRSIWTKDPIFKYIDEGTRIRYATMTKNFKGKTRPRYITSYKGQGGVAFISKKHPRPGIQNRKQTNRTNMQSLWKNFSYIS